MDHERKPPVPTYAGHSPLDSKLRKLLSSKETVKYTCLRLKEDSDLIGTLPDYSQQFNSSVRRAQSQLAQGLKLPPGGVICLSSNQTKLAGKPVYFFLSTGASAHVPREKNTMHEVYTLPEELRNGTHDKLRLRSNVHIIALMDKDREQVVFSDFLIKFSPNKSRKERAMLITSQAIYNFTRDSYKRPKRRIKLTDLQAVSQSTVKNSHEFVLHVPTQHDYRFLSLNRPVLLDCLGKAYSACTGKTLRRNYVKSNTLEHVSISKGMGKSKRRKYLSIQEQLDQRPPEELMKEAKADGSGSYSGWSESAPAKVTLDDFILTKVIGRGSFGKVYLAKKKTAPRKGEYFALKVLIKQVVKDKDQVEHTMAERKVMEQITHPFLMKLHYAFQNASRLYFVMDYLPGGEIFFHLSRKKFDSAKVRFYISQIILGIGHLHANNIIYRDLKPENVLLDADGNVRITDFGLAKKGLGAKQTTDTFCGTPEYLAPEIIQGLGHGRPVDWWSVGILTYEMLVGCPPFTHNNVQVLYSKILKEDPSMPASLVQPLPRRFILACCNKNWRKRLGTRGGVEEVKKHDFLSGMNWTKLLQKKITPPFIPKVKGDSDTRFVAHEFLSEAVESTPMATEYVSADVDEGFENFDFAGDS